MALALATMRELVGDNVSMSHYSSPSATDASQFASQELQNRFISNNLRRVFLLIYRIVRNVDDAQDLTQESVGRSAIRQVARKLPAIRRRGSRRVAAGSPG